MIFYYNGVYIECICIMAETQVKVKVGIKRGMDKISWLAFNFS